MRHGRVRPYEHFRLLLWASSQCRRKSRKHRGTIRYVLADWYVVQRGIELDVDPAVALETCRKFMASRSKRQFKAVERK